MRKIGEVAVLGMALAALPAAAQDVLQLTAGASVTRDDNVFRLPESANPQGDTFSSAYVGVRFDKPYVQQRFLLDATLTAYRYERFSHLDFEATQYRAAWNWRATNRVSGTLSAARSQSLVNYSDFRDPTQRNVRTTQDYAFGIDSRLTGGWFLTSSLLQQESRNSVTFLQERGFRQQGGEVGAKYLAGSGSSASLVHRRLAGDYLERGVDPALLIDDGFLRKETEAALSWVLGGRSSLQARLARTDYESNNFEQRDFTGHNASLGLRYALTARIGLDLVVARTESPSSDAFRRRVEQRYTAGAAWELGPRTVFKASAYFGDSEFREPVLAIAGPPRDERLRGGSLGIDWRAHRLLTLSASAQRQARDSSDPAFDFRGSTATLSASLVY